MGDRPPRTIELRSGKVLATGRRSGDPGDPAREPRRRPRFSSPCGIPGDRPAADPFKRPDLGHRRHLRCQRPGAATFTRSSLNSGTAAGSSTPIPIQFHFGPFVVWEVLAQRPGRRCHRHGRAGRTTARGLAQPARAQPHLQLDPDRGRLRNQPRLLPGQAGIRGLSRTRGTEQRGGPQRARPAAQPGHRDLPQGGDPQPGRQQRGVGGTRRLRRSHWSGSQRKRRRRRTSASWRSGSRSPTSRPTSGDWPNTA